APRFLQSEVRGGLHLVDSRDFKIPQVQRFEGIDSRGLRKSAAKHGGQAHQDSSHDQSPSGCDLLRIHQKHSLVAIHRVPACAASKIRTATWCLVLALSI